MAKHYNDLAKVMNEKYFSVVTKDKELAFLLIESPEAKNYLKEMNYCLDYALANRKIMMERMFEAFLEVLRDCTHDEIINESHNFAAWENQFNPTCKSIIAMLL